MGTVGIKMGTVGIKIGWDGGIVCQSYEMRSIHVLTIVHVRAHSWTESRIPEP
jgi:hypothetical protein